MRFDDYEINEIFRAASLRESLESFSGALKRLELGEENLIEMPTSDRLHSARLTIPDFRAGSNGKGTTAEQAKVSAYSEMIERLCTLETGLDVSPYRMIDMSRVKLIYYLKTFRHIKGHRWCHQDCSPNMVRIEDLLRMVPLSPENFEFLKLESELLRDWVPAHSLISGKEVFIPPMFIRWISSTNGLASGNTIEEAIIHAFCEIIERFVLLHFIRGQARNIPNVDVNSIRDEEILSILAYFESNDVEVTIKDLTDGGVFPAYAVITTTRELSPKFVGYNTIKVGCHFDAHEALKRAFTERMQGTSFTDEARIGFIDPKETDIMLPLYLKGICLFNLDDYKPGPPVPMQNFTYSTTHEALEKMKVLAEMLNSDIMVVDFTNKQIKIPVVRLIMPAISDFIGWWEPAKVNLNFIGNIKPEDKKYERKLEKFLKTF